MNNLIVWLTLIVWPGTISRPIAVHTRHWEFVSSTQKNGMEFRLDALLKHELLVSLFYILFGDVWWGIKYNTYYCLINPVAYHQSSWPGPGGSLGCWNCRESESRRGNHCEPLQAASCNGLPTGGRWDGDWVSWTWDLLLIAHAASRKVISVGSVLHILTTAHASSSVHISLHELLLDFCLPVVFRPLPMDYQHRPGRGGNSGAFAATFEWATFTLATLVEMLGLQQIQASVSQNNMLSLNVDIV